MADRSAIVATARRAKAEQLARVAAQLGITPALAAALDDSAWLSLHRLAGTASPPSTTTRTLVVHILEETSRDHDRQQARDRHQAGRRPDARMADH